MHQAGVCPKPEESASSVFWHLGPVLPFFSVSAVYLAWHNPIRPPDFPLPILPLAVAANSIVVQFFPFGKSPRFNHPLNLKICFSEKRKLEMVVVGLSTAFSPPG
jgi:hypothetical protein